ncbi:1-acyl-sn-glycerol-3-phosphate acyltransferase [Gemmata sp. G18]|uniref:1-acyl-sn-glycerol-3-phosphate acyltransferase n=1 Tax=Gemmata palustris TaxID=2822762 RepID=A0ABS5C0W5_9BACT|nr:lysophospholipid acyltransferase family protein [Gemmata palustris]MBP3959633.1 1-acyl-sn-glycerol-3-phosphate acyltransferase [Gemmata palustris]
MPESESPQVRRDRHSALGAAAIVCLSVPALAILVIDSPADARRGNVLWLVGSMVGFALLPFLYWAPYRALGLVPLAAVAWLAAVGHGVYWGEWPGWAHGAPLGLIVGALARGRRGQEPWPETAALFGATLVGFGIAWACVTRGRPFAAPQGLVLIASVALVGWSWARLFRPLFELVVEPVLWLMYRVRRAGPGFTDFPRTGPCLVIANHACWLDPVFLAKVLPRPLTPMMTAKFYDLPLIRRLMVAFGIIRVPEKALKKDAPELLEAIAALDRGECVVIFPEGYLRRSEDRPLRRFGQGVWQVLKARPSTPVFATWIEGAWGSYTSHSKGVPMKNKKPDFRRSIGVGASAAVVVPPDILSAHLPTRTHLMNLVGAARVHLGLDPLPPFELPAKTDDIENEG